VTISVLLFTHIQLTFLFIFLTVSRLKLFVAFEIRLPPQHKFTLHCTSWNVQNKWASK